MDLREALRRRRMVRSFSDQPVAPEVLDRLLGDTLSAPSAGNTCGTAWVALVGPEETGRYWSAATTPSWRAASRRWPGLSRAPVVAVSLASPEAYVARYAEPDKARAATGPRLGDSAANWPVPYWFGDAAFAVMALLLGATAEGLGACFLGNFRSEDRILAALGVPEGWRLFGAVVLGHPEGDDPPSGSLARARPGPEQRLRYGSWAGRPR